MGEPAPQPDGDHELPPLALAQVWVSRVTTVVLEMILPGIGGNWLDKRWGTDYLVLLGFAFGLTLGIWHLIQMTKPRPTASSAEDAAVQQSDSEDKT